MKRIRYIKFRKKKHKKKIDKYIYWITEYRQKKDKEKNRREKNIYIYNKSNK